MRRRAGLLIFLPLFGCGDSFESALARSIDAPRRHWTTPSRGEETWTEGDRYAHLARNGKSVYAEARHDGSRTAWFMALPMSEPPPGVPRRPAPEPMGIVGSGEAVGPAALSDPLVVFRDHPYAVLAARSKGQGREYDVRSDGPLAVSCCGTVPKPPVYRVSTDRSGRIVALAMGNRVDARFDYPEAIPADTFAPKLRYARTIDEKEARATFSKSAKEGLGRIGGSTIRSAVLDAQGLLTVLRTGALTAPFSFPAGTSSQARPMLVRTPEGLAAKHQFLPARPVSDRIAIRIGSETGDVTVLRYPMATDLTEAAGHRFVPFLEWPADIRRAFGR